MDDKQIAQTILKQLGGGKFAVVTGAKNFVGGNRALSFTLPSNFCKNGVNRVKVQLEWNDTYTVTFSKVWGKKVTEFGRFEDVYCDELQDLFERETGLSLMFCRVRYVIG